jgi:hypothetical protein
MGRNAVATKSPRNGISVGAGLRVTEKCTNTLIELRADDVFELACLIVGFGIVDGKCVGEKALGEAVTAHYITRALGAQRGEFDLTVL